MDRIYTNRLPGQERIHVEIDSAEVADLLDDLPTEDPEWFEATKKLRILLIQADKDFHRARWNSAAPVEKPAIEGVKHSGPDTRFCVLCLSGGHDHATEEPTR